MIKTEFFMVRGDGVELYRTYSDEGYFITRDDEIYEEAVDPAGFNRVYVETDEKIPDWEAPVVEEEEPTEEEEPDYEEE